MKITTRNILFLLVQMLFALNINAQDVIRYVSTNLNLRMEPNTSSQVITVIPIGTPITIEEDCDCEWIPVSYNKKIGYVSTKFLSRQKVEPKSNINTTPKKYYTNSKGERVQSSTKYNSVPSGATALCRDGTYSFSRNRRGTCSHHGGVARWL